MSAPAEARRLLREVFGFESFRPGQDAIVAAVAAGEEVLAVMPTGSGKSLCYQLPALMADGLTVVVSPLIALMRDQVAQLSALGVAAASLTSANDAGENRRILDDARAGRLKLLYAAPERLSRGEWLGDLRGTVRALAIDEAHCVSQWGHDFRPEYLALGQMREVLGPIQTVALTATADAATRDEIAARLFAAPPRIFVGGFDRPNLRLAMRPKGQGGGGVVDFVAAHPGDSGIVYCASRAKTEAMAAKLVAAGIRALPYHAGLDSAVRGANQDAFLAEDGMVMAATVAFGMGIDKPDVRFVCHADLPKSIESYYQEIGRAGRDGLPADTLTFYGMEDVRLHRLRIEEGGASDERKRVEHRRLEALLALCEAPRCRRQTLLAYFGETDSAPCGNCDLCLEGAKIIDGTMDAQKAMSAMVRTGQRFGTEHLVNLLLGVETDAIRRLGHHALPTFGVGAGGTRDHWRSVFRQIYASGLVTQDLDGPGGWRMTEAGAEVLRGRGTVALRAVPAAGRSKRGRAAAAAVAVDAAAQPLLARLKALRLRLAAGEGVPAYVVFPDRTLIELATRRPATLAEMADIHGIGRAKLDRYGEVFLAAIAEA